MSTKNTEQKPLPPYVSYRTFRNFLERMQEGIPSRIDRSVMGSGMAGGTVTQLLTALKALNLIDDTGKPQDTLEKLVATNGEERRSALQDVLKNAYPSIFQLDLKRASAQEFREKFKEFTAKDDVANKCQAFFRQAAEDAGIELSPYIIERAKIAVQPRKRHKPKNLGADVTLGRRRGAITSRSVEEMILQKYPEFDPQWSQEAQEAWMAGIMKLYAELKGTKGTEEESEQKE